MAATLVIRVSVDCDPRLVDPLTVIEEILDAYDNDRNPWHSFVVADEFLEAEWDDD